MTKEQAQEVEKKLRQKISKEIDVRSQYDKANREYEVAIECFGFTVTIYDYPNHFGRFVELTKINLS